MHWAKGSMDHHDPSDRQIHKPPENHDHGHFSCPHRHPSWGNGSPGMARSRPGGARQRTWGHATLPRNPPTLVSGVLDLDDRTKNAGVEAAEWLAHFLGKVLLAELE